MLNWCNRFNICCFLDNHNYHLSHNSVECLAGAGAETFLEAEAGHTFDTLHEFHRRERDWLFGHFAYDLKNEIEHLSSGNPDMLGFPDLFFFVPRVVLRLQRDSLSIGSLYDDHDAVFRQIANEPADSNGTKPVLPHVRHRYTRDEYVATVESIRRHILRGDCYEMNFCQEFYAENIDIDPLLLYHLLSEASPNPFSAFYKLPGRFLCCMSPERYLKKEGRHILSQPIKGTSKRDASNPHRDQLNLRSLSHSEKERAENIMVVDLVRNDLSRIATQGSVQVDELCAVYSFPQVHQMVSTITGELRAELNWTDAIRATFPMGSMTGAPKKKVMELIEQYERTKRGLFSGSLGYVTPEGDFDLNVVIRSVLYNSSVKYLSFQAGSAITFASDAEEEYEECLLKADAIKKALVETNAFH